MQASGMIALLWLAGCAAPEPGADTPAPRTYGEDDLDDLAAETPEPAYTAAEMSEAAAGMIALGFPNSKAPYLAYKNLLTFRDDTCPNAGDQLVGQEMPLGGCTAASGVHYEGNTILIETDETTEGGGGVRGASLGGDFLIEDAEGYQLAGGGIMTHQVTASGDGLVTWLGEASGTWYHTRRSDWLGVGVSATLRWRGEEGGPADGMTIDGTIGLEGVYMRFVELAWNDTCGDQPVGIVRLRDPTGVWATLDFGERCDGCGTYTVDGQDTGEETCLDLRLYGAAMREMGTW